MPLNHDNQGFLIGDPIEIDKAMSALSDIRDDIHAIRTALAGKDYTIPTPSKLRQTGSDSPSSMPPQIATPRNNRPQSQLTRSLPPISEKIAKPGKVSAISSNRDNSGRFTGGNSSEVRSGNDRFVDGSQGSNAALREVADKIVSAAGNAGSGMEETDPTVKAFNEVAQPAARGYESMMSIRNRDEHRKDGWFRKIFTELKLFRKEETVFNKAANSSLKNIEENPASGQSEGGSSWLRRYILPVTMGLLGSILAGSTKGFVERFIDANERVMEKYIAAPIRSMVESISSFIDGVSNKIDSAWNVFTGFVKDKIGIDIQGAVDTAKVKISDSANAIKESSAGKAVSNAIESAKESPAGKFISKTMDGIASAKDWVLGQTSKMFESGKGGAGTVSTGKGDFGGASYGTYQLSSKKGALQDFLKSTKYGEQFQGMTPGTPEFNAKWKEIAKNDPSFGDSQHAFIKSTHFDPQMAKLKKSGIDLSGRGAAVQDSIWSTAVQFGGDSSLIMKALHGKDVSGMSDKDIVSAIQDYKLTNNESLFRSSDANVRQGTANRATAEKNKLIALAENSIPTLASSNFGDIKTTSLPTPSSPQMPQPIKLSEAPQIENLIGSLGGSGRNTVVASAPPADVGQDVRDRGIAHIVTGGLSN